MTRMVFTAATRLLHNDLNLRLVEQRGADVDWTCDRTRQSFTFSHTELADMVRTGEASFQTAGGGEKPMVPDVPEEVEACAVWGPQARLDMQTCNRLAQQGRVAMTRYEPPGENSRRQKRWSARDLIAHAQQGRTRLIDAIGADQARRTPPMERKR